MSAAAVPTVSTAFNSAGKRSIGDVFIEIQNVALISGDVSCVATATSLSRVDYAIWICNAAPLTSVATYSGAAATFAFADPAATVKGTVILFGR